MPQPVSRRVLVAEDNEDAGNTLKMLLEALGHEVFLVSNGAAAVEAVERFRPEVIILDIGMPVMDGYEAATRIRHGGRRNKTPIIALTGWGSLADRAKAQRAGIDHHLLKPLKLPALLAIFDSLPRPRRRK